MSVRRRDIEGAEGTRSSAGVHQPFCAGDEVGGISGRWEDTSKIVRSKQSCGVPERDESSKQLTGGVLAVEALDVVLDHHKEVKA